MDSRIQIYKQAKTRSRTHTYTHRQYATINHYRQPHNEMCKRKSSYLNCPFHRILLFLGRTPGTNECVPFLGAAGKEMCRTTTLTMAQHIKVAIKLNIGGWCDSVQCSMSVCVCFFFMRSESFFSQMIRRIQWEYILVASKSNDFRQAREFFGISNKLQQSG